MINKLNIHITKENFEFTPEQELLLKLAEKLDQVIDKLNELEKEIESIRG